MPSALPTALGAAFAAYQVYDICTRRASWKGTTESVFFTAYKNACAWAVEKTGLTYAPSDVSGKMTSIPSTSAPVFKAPTTLEDASAFTPLRLRGLTLRNRVIRAAAFDGESTEEISATHAAVAAGGVGMTVVAYCAVSSEGRTFAEQTVMNEDAIAKFRPVTSAVHSRGAKICCQLTHGGACADASIAGEPQLTPSVIFSPMGFSITTAIDHSTRLRLIDDFKRAARIAIAAGFDAVEVHCGHGYLLSQWMSPVLNRRIDEYGGSAINRARFPIECLRAVREAVGTEVPILVKMNAFDGVFTGLEISDAIIMAQEFAANGADMIVPSCGVIFLNAFTLLRGAVPYASLIQGMHGHVLRLATMIFAPLAVPVTEYEACFLRDVSREILRALEGTNTKVCLLGGVNSLGAIEGALEEGFAAVQMARTLIREPDFMLRCRDELIDKTAAEDDVWDVETKCIQCNQCVLATVDPTLPFGCPFRRMEERRDGFTPRISLSKEVSHALLDDVVAVEARGSNSKL